MTLVPSSFSTGSYGWKGSKRITVELQTSEDGGAKEKVQVMFTYVPYSAYSGLLETLTPTQDQCYSFG
jgi:hypothetical protein